MCSSSHHRPGYAEPPSPHRLPAFSPVARGGFCICHPISSACFEPTFEAAHVMRF